MYYLGIDHQKRYSQVAVMDEKGKVHINGKIAHEKLAFSLLKEYLRESCKAAVEAGHNSGIMYDLLEQLDIEVTVAHLLKTRVIADAKIMSDSIDARALAHLLRVNLTPSVHVPPRKVERTEESSAP